MSKYKNLDKFLEKKGKKPKKREKKDITKLSNSERKELIDEMLRDFRYIE